MLPIKKCNSVLTIVQGTRGEVKRPIACKKKPCAPTDGEMKHLL
jgi:hypothetical protein